MGKVQGKVSPLSSSSRPPQPSLTTSSSSAVTQLLPTWQPSPLRARPSIPGICPVLDILAYLEFLPCLNHTCHPGTLTLLKNWQIFCSPAPHPSRILLALSKMPRAGEEHGQELQPLHRSCSASARRGRPQKETANSPSSSDTRRSQQPGWETAAFPTPAAFLSSRNSNSPLISQAEVALQGFWRKPSRWCSCFCKVSTPSSPGQHLF